MIEIINKIMVILYVLSCLNVIRHSLIFVRQFRELDNDENMRYKITKSSLLILGLSISYIITGIINGITI